MSDTGRNLAAAGALVALAVLGLSLAKPQTPAGPDLTAKAADEPHMHPERYTSLCATALVKFQHQQHDLERADLIPDQAHVMRDGPPPRVFCGISEGTYAGAISFDAPCTDWQSSGCVNLLAVQMGDRIVWLSPQSRAEIAGASKAKRNH